MSLTSTLNNAYSGLVATQRAAELVSNNISNALTEGYARRTLGLASGAVAGVDGGVWVSGIARSADPRATADRRRAEGSEAGDTILAEARARVATAFGEPGAEGALSTLATAFGEALRAAADTPESLSVQGNLLNAAKYLVQGLNEAQDETVRMRQEADSSIATQVNTLNARLEEIEELNRAIRTDKYLGKDTSTLEDRRHVAIDEVNRIVPIRVARRAGDEVALYTGGGAVLLDGSAGTFAFSETPTITPDMTLASGALSTLTLNGRVLDTGTGGALGSGGTLGAAFAIRDEIATTADSQLDAMAEDLVTRFEGVDTDAGGAGLFTDGGSALNTATLSGLAGRLAVNAAADPDQGGEYWRLRDGLQAATQGTAGDASLLQALSDAYTGTVTAPTGTGLTGDFSAVDLASALSALAIREAAQAEDAASFAAGQASTFRDTELGLTGVDTDQEMQRLLLVERSYAANARVIQTVDALFRELLEI